MSNSRRGKDITRKSDKELLCKLKSADSWDAWTEFLNRYASLIYQTANQFEFEQDRKNDCFLFVSEKLSQDGFKRLLKYKPTRKASFRNWLITVVFNLCIDWHRKEFGRASLAPSISALPAFDQLVYRYNFEQGLTTNDCLQLLSADFPDVTGQQLSQAIARIHRMLSPRQRWQIRVRLQRKQRSGERRLQEVDQLPSPESDPLVMAQESQQIEALQSALEALTDRQRLILHFRFHDGLTLKQIAQFAELGDSNRVWREIQEALQALSEQFEIGESIQFRKK
jgi:RNA polymerase sigma factor (sigma-70 family)